MKNKTQIENALLQIAPRASDALERLAARRAAGKGDVCSEAEFRQAAATIDILRWVLDDGNGTDLPLADYLCNLNRIDDLIAFLDRFSRSARN